MPDFFIAWFDVLKDVRVFWWIVYLEILLVAAEWNRNITFKYHELAHAKTAMKYGHRTFIVFKDAKDKAFKEKIHGIDAYHLTKEQYKEYIDRSSAASAYYDINCYNKEEERITLAGPIDTTKRLLLAGIVITVLLAFLKRVLPGLNGIAFPNIILSYFIAEFIVCYAQAWFFWPTSMDKFENVVKERIRSGNAADKKKPFGVSVSDGTKLLFRTKYSELVDLIYADENRDWFPNFDDTLKQMEKLTATKQKADMNDAT